MTCGLVDCSGISLEKGHGGSSRASDLEVQVRISGSDALVSHKAEGRNQKFSAGSFDFPFKNIESCLLRSFLHEEPERASQAMARNDDYIRALGD